MRIWGFWYLLRHSSTPARLLTIHLFHSEKTVLIYWPHRCTGTFTNYFLCNVSGCLDIKQDNKQAASDAAVCQLVFRFQVAPPVKHAGRHPPSSVTLCHACLPHPHFQDEMPLAHTAWRDIHPAERERERVQTVELEQKRKRETDRLVTKWRNRSDPPFSA